MHDIEHYLFHTPIWLIVDIGINKFVLLNLNCLVSCPSLCDGNLTSLPYIIWVARPRNLLKNIRIKDFS